jgi:hypothetical protein
MVVPSQPRQIGRRGAAPGQRDAAISPRASRGHAEARTGWSPGGDRAIAPSAHAGAAEQDSPSSAAVGSARNSGERVENVRVDPERMQSKLPDFHAVVTCAPHGC